MHVHTPCTLYTCMHLYNLCLLLGEHCASNNQLKYFFILYVTHHFTLFFLHFFYTAGLPTTKLSSFLEDRVNSFLQNELDVGKVTIRVVSSSDKVLDTRMGMRERFMGEFPSQFPYRTKALFAFQEIDGVDVCFFGMHVQEYGSDCPAPNTRYKCKYHSVQRTMDVTIQFIKSQLCG